jgi:FKBP-type peptidyl-prolyl cis-trans isomerase 2
MKNDVIENQFESGGGHLAGASRKFDEAHPLFSFNHPLATRPLKFEANTIGIR